MDRILETEESYATRMHWGTIHKDKFNCKISLFLSFKTWEDVAMRIYEKTKTKRERIDLVKQCRAIGLMNRASEIEQGSGNFNEKELQEMYNESQK